MTESSSDTTPIHEALNRPILLMGGERQLVLMLMIIAGVFIISLANIWCAVIGVALWLIGQWALSKAAAYDPQLSKTGPGHCGTDLITRPAQHHSLPPGDSINDSKIQSF